MRSYLLFSGVAAVFIITFASCASDEAAVAAKEEKGVRAGHDMQTLQIAVCNMDKVAEELGFLSEIKRNIATRNVQLTNKVRTLQAEKQMELNKKIEQFGDKPSEEQQKQLAKMQFEANRILRNAQNQANQIMDATRKSLVEQIRTKIKAPIDKVATEKGISIVVSQHPDFILFTTNAADITGEVISVARQASLSPLVPEAASEGDEPDGLSSDIGTKEAEDQPRDNDP
ncbi:MAG: OmpH family outer membrane protein [Planctomycetota bacterium]|nr:OmpH family outer membrane protein [Planctomycetota bacterium]